MYVFLIYLWVCHRNILVAQRISWKMASRVSKQVDASQRFLRGLQSLPSFAETRSKQAEQLLATVERVQNFTVEEANKVLEIFSESLWGPDLSERFKAQLSAGTNLIQPSACGRRPLQNYLALPRYLTQSLWTSLQGSEPEELRLEKLVRHAARLGLRCPTEPTFAMLLTLSFQGARTEQKQRQVLSEHKPRIKRWLNEPSPADYLEVLPEDVNLLLASLVAAAFGQDPRVDCPLDEKQLLGVAMQWPLRQRQSGGSMLAAPAIPTWEASTMGPFLSGIAAASAYAAHWGPAASGQRGLVTIGTPGVTLESVQSSAGSSGAMGSGTPVPRVVSGTPVATAEPEQLRAAGQEPEQLRAAGQEPIQQKPLLALEDRVEPPPQASHVDRAQEQLKSSVAVVTASPTRGQRSESSVQKKPAGKKASKPVLKKPACVKRPAAQPKASKAAKREELLARIPQALKKRFKDGCTKCRNRPLCTVSCWRLRGFE